MQTLSNVLVLYKEMPPYLKRLYRVVRRNDLIRALMVGMLALVANQAAAIDIFVHAPAPFSRKAVRATVALNERIFELQPGDKTTIRAPSGKDYSVTFERVEIGYGGTRTWVGHLTDAGKNFRVFISTGNGQT